MIKLWNQQEIQVPTPTEFDWLTKDDSMDKIFLTVRTSSSGAGP